MIEGVEMKDPRRRLRGSPTANVFRSEPRGEILATNIADIG